MGQENLRALALDLAIRANPPLMGGTLPSANLPQAGLGGIQQIPNYNNYNTSGTFYTTPQTCGKILTDAAAFLAFLAPEKPRRAPVKKQSRRIKR